MILIGSLVAYLAVLVMLGRRGRVKHSPEYYDSGRTLSARAVFVMVTALWSSSTIAVEIDTAYRYGISAAWFGASVAVMSILVSLLVPLFRRMNYVTNSSWLGSHFGPGLQRLTAMVIGLTFPIFALSNALVAAFFLHVAMGWPLWISLAVITGIMVVYVQFGGIVSLAYTQGLNLIMMLGGLGLIVWHLAQWTGPAHAVPAGFWRPTGIGSATILVWFGMNTLNVFSAQAEYQAVAGAQNVRHAQRAVWLSSAVLVAVVLVATGVGTAVRVDFGTAHSGLQAFSLLMTTHIAPWMKTGIALGIWALALTWCGPLLFSGASSLGRDVLGHDRMVQITRWALVLEGVLMIGYGLWRPGAIAWWRVFGLTLRNAAVVIPTIAALIWSDLSPKVVLGAVLAGVGTGMGLNAMTGFSATHFIGGVNPMWISATVGFIVLVIGRVYTKHVPYRRSVVSILVLAIGAIWGMNGHEIPTPYTGVLLVVVSLVGVGVVQLLNRPQGVALWKSEAAG